MTQRGCQEQRNGLSCTSDFATTTTDQGNNDNQTISAVVHVKSEKEELIEKLGPFSPKVDRNEELKPIVHIKDYNLLMDRYEKANESNK